MMSLTPLLLNRVNSRDWRLANHSAREQHNLMYGNEAKLSLSPVDSIFVWSWISNFKARIWSRDWLGWPLDQLVWVVDGTDHSTQLLATCTYVSNTKFSHHSQQQHTIQYFSLCQYIVVTVLITNLKLRSHTISNRQFCFFRTQHTKKSLNAETDEIKYNQDCQHNSKYS